MVVEGALTITVADTRAENVHGKLGLSVDTGDSSGLKSLDVAVILMGGTQVMV